MMQNNALFQAKQNLVRTAIAVAFEASHLIKKVMAENEKLKQHEESLFKNKFNDEAVRNVAVRKLVDYKLANEFLETFYKHCLIEAQNKILTFNKENDSSLLYLHFPDKLLTKLHNKHHQDVYKNFCSNTSYQTAKTQFIRASKQINDLQAYEENKWFYLQIAGLILLAAAVVSAILIGVYVCPLAGSILLFTLSLITAIALLSTFFMPKNSLNFLKNSKTPQVLPDDDSELKALLAMKPIVLIDQAKPSAIGTFASKKTQQINQHDANRHQKAPCC